MIPITDGIDCLWRRDESSVHVKRGQSVASGTGMTASCRINSLMVGVSGAFYWEAAEPVGSTDRRKLLNFAMAHTHVDNLGQKAVGP